MAPSSETGTGIEVVWEGGRRYRAGRPGTPTLLLDGERRVAPGPVDALIAALASCAAMDVVEYLEKRRTPAASLGVSVQFARAAAAPRRVTEAWLLFRVDSEAAREHVARVVELTLEKYCSVASSLAPDLRITWEVEIAACVGLGGGIWAPASIG